jgi:hypothetical protein
MSFSKRIGLIILGLLFAGCSGNAPSASSEILFTPGNAGALVPQTRDQHIPVQSSKLMARASLPNTFDVATPSAAGTDDLYVAAFFLTDIANYHMPNRRGHVPYCTITGPQQVNGIGVDRNGVLWVPQEASGIVTSYAPGCGAPGITLTDNSLPIAIAFGPKGVNYVVEWAHANVSYVAVFPKGATTPSRQLKSSAIGYGAQGFGIGVDRKGNVFFGFAKPDDAGGGIVEFFHGRGQGQLLSVGTTGSPGASITFDGKGNMLVPDFTNAMVDVFAPPYSALTSTIPLKGTSYQCALNESENSLACADGEYETADLYSYPAGKYEYSFNKGLGGGDFVGGIAFDPSAR